MSADLIKERYDTWMRDGGNTVEKHVRWIAEQCCREVEDGFAPNSSVYGERQYPFRCRGEDHKVQFRIPYGLYGFALRLALEDEIRSQLGIGEEA